MRILFLFSLLTASLLLGACEDAAPYKKELAELKLRTAHLDKELDKASKHVNNAARCELQVKRLNAKVVALEKQVEFLDDSKRRKKVEALSSVFKVQKGEKLYATFDTSMGSIHVELFWEKAPFTVANFVQLAEGTKPWKDPVTQKLVERPLYDGTLFHRVIPDFMIQGGAPDNKANGGPGFTFIDEFHPDLRHDRPGILSMANSGKDTNGSQFFITAKATPYLDDKHAVFGALVDAKELAVIKAITSVEKSTSSRSHPKKDIVLKRIRIGRGSMKR